MREADEVAVELALRQHGVFGRWQLRARSVHADAIDRRIGTQWVRHTAGVYGLPGAPRSFEQRVWIAWLAVGPNAIVSHEAAAQLRNVPNVHRNRVTLTVPHSNFCRIPGTFVHQISDVRPGHHGELMGLPVTTVARTIVDLGASVHRERLRHIVEDAKQARLVTYEDVGSVLREVARRGKPGVRVLTRVLDELTTTKARSQSRLESALVDLLRRARLSTYQLQYPHPGRQFTSGCVDTSFVAAKQIIEVDGRAWHTRIADIKRDHDRDNDAARAGWDTLRLLYEHVVGDPDGTTQLIKDVLLERSRILDAIART